MIDLAVSECLFCGQTIAGEEFTDCCRECMKFQNIFEETTNIPNHDDQTTELVAWFLKYQNTRTVFYDANSALNYAEQNKLQNFEISRIP